MCQYKLSKRRLSLGGYVRHSVIYLWRSISIMINSAAATASKSLQSCLTLCDPIDGSPPGSPFPGILQARTLEWADILFSNIWKWKVKVKLLSRVRLLATPWTAAYQAPPSMGFCRQECWSGVPLSSPKRFYTKYFNFARFFCIFKAILIKIPAEFVHMFVLICVCM